MSSPTNLYRKLNSMLMWLKDRAVKIAQKDTRNWWMMSVGLWLASSIAVLIAGLGNPTGLGLVFDLLLYFALNLVVFCLSTILVAFLLSLLYLPVPRLYAGGLLYTGCIVYYILYAAKLGILFSVIIGLVYSIAAVLIGLGLAMLSSRKMTVLGKIILVILPVVLSLSFLLWRPAADSVQTMSEGDDARHIVPLQVENPGEPGSFAYHYFTYGSGADKHRQEFGVGADLLSDPVDASAYIDQWSRARYLFWGFDETELPLSGRVWMPEGEGPFPLVLIVHGNHRMEYFSDDGYGYLGELLASRGFITVSIDQNFLNYSSWSGIPKQDMKLRAWVLMQHLLQIEKFQALPTTPFYERVDLQHVALIGHSRGGQAAAMVADYTTWFAEDSSIAGMENIGIRAVVGLAPTDRRIDGKRAALADTYYLVLHGARDADVNSFRGDRQYARARYEEGSERFKASLYIAAANHSQFNMDWGSMDISLPGGLFLNRKQTMEASLQRKIVKLYISALLETALHGNEQYVPLFRDFRYGRNWLPDTQYMSRFENGRFIPLTDFDRSRDKTQFAHDITVNAEGFALWELQEAEDRRGNKKGTRGTVLEWDDGGAYTISVSDQFRQQLLTEKPESLQISMANMALDVHSIAGSTEPLPRVEVELESKDEVSVRIALDQFMPLAAPIYTQYAHITWLDTIMRNGKYSQAAEPVVQMYELPLSAFAKLNPHFQAGEITKITFHFSNGPGKVMLDNIGFRQR